MPHLICEICLEQVNAAYEFKNKLEQSDTILRTYIMRKNITIKEESDHDFQNSLISIKPEITIIEGDTDTIDANDPLNENYIYNEIKQDIAKQNTFRNDSISEYDNEPDYPEDDGDLMRDDNYEDDGNYEYSDSGAGSSNNEKNQKEDDVAIDVAGAKNEQGRYNCQFCDKTLVDAKGLKLHIRLHTGLNLKRCTICSRGLYHD